MEKRVSELETTVADKSVRLATYEKLEHELDDVIMQAADGRCATACTPRHCTTRNYICHIPKVSHINVVSEQLGCWIHIQCADVWQGPVLFRCISVAIQHFNSMLVHDTLGYSIKRIRIPIQSESKSGFSKSCILLMNPNPDLLNPA